MPTFEYFLDIVVTQLFVNSYGFSYTTVYMMEQIYTLFCSITLFNLASWMFIVINSSIMNNFTTVQELSSTPENTQWQQNVFQGSRTQPVLIANSRKVLGAQRRLANLAVIELRTMETYYQNRYQLCLFLFSNNVDLKNNNRNYGAPIIAINLFQTMKLSMILLRKGTSAPVTPLFTGQGARHFPAFRRPWLHHWCVSCYQIFVQFLIVSWWQ